MKEDPIISELRRHREEHAAKYGNDLAKICEALRLEEKELDAPVINRGPKPLLRETGT